MLGEAFLQGRDAMSLPPIDLAVFHENGYLRKQCTITGLWFWTTDELRETCGDTAEDEYSFIGAPLNQGYPMRGKALKDAMREIGLKCPESIITEANLHFTQTPSI